MNLNKIFLCDGASLLETELLGLKESSSIKESTYFTNTKFQSLINKVILINLPIEIDLLRLSQFNRFIIRYPIEELDKIKAQYELIEYDLSNIESVVDESEVSCLILNKYLLTDIDQVKKIKNKKFLLGTEYAIGDYVNLIGYMILKYDYTNLNITDPEWVY